MPGYSDPRALEGVAAWLREQAAARRGGDTDALDTDVLAAARRLAGRRPA